MPKITHTILEECVQKGGDFYSNLANALYQTCNENTRQKAKSAVFFYLYGGGGGWEPGSQEQVEGRTHRVGTRTYKVRVFRESDMAGVTCGGQGLEDLDTEHTDYTVVAQSELDARCLAFVLDGGCEYDLTNFDDGHIELALTWTEVIE